MSHLRLLVVLCSFAALASSCQREPDASRQASAAAGDAATSQRAGETGFNGVFHLASSEDARAQSILNITEHDGTVTGMIDAAAITARVDGTRASGEVKHPRTGNMLGTVNLSLEADTLTVTLTAKDPRTGQSMELPTKTYARGAPPPVDVQLDAQLIGQWRQTWTAPRSSPDEVPETIDVWLVLNSDGSAQHGKFAPETNALPVVGIETTADDGFAGRWRTSEQMLLVKPTGHTRWVPLARYRVDGDELHLTYHDGNQQTYQRQ